MGPYLISTENWGNTVEVKVVGWKVKMWGSDNIRSKLIDMPE